MEREEIKKVLNRLLKDMKREFLTKYLKKHNKEIQQEIINHTLYLSNDCIFGERIYHILNDLYERPKCKMCDNKLEYVRGTYKIYCSVKCARNDPEYIEKRKQTNLKKYGCENPSQNKKVKEKIKQTNLKNFGVENVFQNKEIKNKSKKTMLKNYGVEHPSYSEEIKNKYKKTNLEKYGVEHPSKNKDILEKSKRTMLKNYGVEYALQNKDCLEKSKQTCFKNYGVDHPSQSKVIQQKKNKKIRIKYDKIINKYLKTMDLILLENYNKSKSTIKFRCLKCGKEFKSCFFNIQQGKRCPYCSTEYNQSKEENELYNYLKLILPNTEIIQNDRNVILNQETNKYLELDIYIPEKKIAIEFDGIYWHSELYRDKEYHLLKTELCKEKGVRLIHIFEDEWMFKQDIVKSRLKQILNINDNKRIHARKCMIKEIDSKTKNNFLEKYHIQGKDNSIIKFGAFYDNELVSIMTFSKGNISKGSKSVDGVFELNRFCSNSKYHIPGIAGKLLKYFQRNYNWDKIFSYADLRWSQGNVYEKIGFNLISQSKPNYWYVNKLERIHRFNLRKKSDESKDITERELRLNEGYLRVYDCGNLKYQLINE